MMKTLPGILSQMAGAGGEILTPIELIASNFIAPGISNPTINKPSGTLDGDLMILQANSRNSYITAVTGGWTPLWQHGIGNTGGFEPRGGAFNEETHCWYRWADSEPASYTFTTSGVDNVPGITTYRNVKAVELYDEQPNTNVLPSVAGANEDWLVGVHGTSYEPGSTPVAPAGMTEIGRAYAAGSDVGTMSVYELLLSGGLTGTRTFTGSLWNNYAVAASIILKIGVRTLRDQVKEISGLQLLLDFNEPGEVVNQWSDLSGQGNHFSTGAGTMPTNGIDGMYFNGSTDYLDGPSFSSLTAGEMLIQMKNDIPVGSPGVVWFGTDLGLGNHHPYTPGNAFYDGFGSNARKGGFGSSYTGWVTTWHTTNYISEAGSYQMLINGTSLYSTGSNTVSFSATPNIGKGLGLYFGWMKGIAFFNRKISTAERVIVQAWLDSL